MKQGKLIPFSTTINQLIEISIISVTWKLFWKGLNIFTTRLFAKQIILAFLFKLIINFRLTTIQVERWKRRKKKRHRETFPGTRTKRGEATQNIFIQLVSSLTHELIRCTFARVIRKLSQRNLCSRESNRIEGCSRGKGWRRSFQPWWPHNGEKRRG